jgi:hypothetical protein
VDQRSELEQQVGYGLLGALDHVGLEVNGLFSHPVLEVLLNYGRLAVDDGKAEGREAGSG